MAPGDPVDLFLGGGSGSAGGEGLSTDRRADAEKTREDLRRQLGLDKPLHIQYLNWLSNIVVRVEDLDGFERGALMADSVLDQLVPARRSELMDMERTAYREEFLREFQRFDPDRVDEFTASDFWQSSLFSLEKNYKYGGAGVELYCADTWRVVSLNFGRSFKDQQPVIDHIFERLPITFEINVISFFIAYLR